MRWEHLMAYPNASKLCKLRLSLDFSLLGVHSRMPPGSCRELQEPIESGGNRFDHFNLLFLLGACARRYQVCGLANEVNNSSSKLVCLERWVNDEGSVVVLNSLAITFQIFKDSSTVEEKIWVGLN
jgi:hypothetical protein